MSNYPISILCIGDPHFQVSNIPEVDLFIKKTLELVKERRPNLIVILGDILHTHEKLHTIPFNKACDFVDALRAFSKTFVIVGNHDYINNKQHLTENHWMNCLKDWKNVVVVDKVIEHKIMYNNSAESAESFVFVPYVYPGRFIEALDTLNPSEHSISIETSSWRNARAIFAHQEFFGCKMGAIISSEGDKWPLDYPCVISGHIHARQILQPNIYYTGSAMQHAFGESKSNILALLHFSHGESTYEREEIDLKLPRKKIIYMDVEDIESYIIPTSSTSSSIVEEEKETQKGDEIKEECGEGDTTETISSDIKLKDQLKLTISGNYEEFKALKKTQKYKNIIASGAKIVFKPKKISKTTSSAGDEQEGVKEHTDTDTDIGGKRDFNTILSDIVTKEGDQYLYQVFELVVNGKDIDPEEVLMI